MADFSKPVEFVEQRVPPECEGMRVDKFLTVKLNWRSRQYYLNMFRENKILVNDKACKKSYKLVAEDIVKILLPPEYQVQFDYSTIDVSILYEDDDMLVVNKQGNLTVQPGGKYIQENLLYRLKSLFRDERGMDDVEPMIVHRIDRETSGVIAFAKHKKAATWLTQQFEKASVKKQYVAIVHGTPDPPQGDIDQPLLSTPDQHMIVSPEGKHSFTHYELEKSCGEFSLVRVFPKTGRQHQIRVHLSHIGHPIVSDELYGGEPDRDKPELPNRQALHAARLEITHPNGERMVFEAPLHEDMARLVRA